MPREESSSAPVPVPLQKGNLRGSVMLAGVEHFLRRYGPAASHEAINALSPTARRYFRPNVPALGVVGFALYPYPVVGELLRAFAAAQHKPEDVLIREVSVHGIDASLGTVNRFALRYLVSVKAVAARSQGTWDLFHDSGRLEVLSCTDNEYVVEVSNWPQHDPSVCKLSMEGRRYLIERVNGKRAELFRDKCQAWGHNVCTSRIRWK